MECHVSNLYYLPSTTPSNPDDDKESDCRDISHMTRWSSVEEEKQSCDNTVCLRKHYGCIKDTDTELVKPNISTDDNPGEHIVAYSERLFKLSHSEKQNETSIFTNLNCHTSNLYESTSTTECNADGGYESDSSDISFMTTWYSSDEDEKSSPVERFSKNCDASICSKECTELSPCKYISHRENFLQVSCGRHNNNRSAREHRDICNKIWISEFDLHGMIHIKEMPCGCNSCNKHFSKKDLSGSHLSIHTENMRCESVQNQPKCIEYNGAEFINSDLSMDEDSVGHIADIKKLYKLSHSRNQDNDSVGNNHEGIEETVIASTSPDISSDEMSKDCAIYIEKFSDSKLSDLGWHDNNQSPENQYECVICNRRFSSRFTLHAHRKIHFKEKNRFECIICHITFPRQANFFAHYKIHNQEIVHGKNDCSNKSSHGSNVVVFSRICAEGNIHTIEMEQQCSGYEGNQHECLKNADVGLAGWDLSVYNSSKASAANLENMLQLSQSHSCKSHNNHKSVNNENECIKNSDTKSVSPHESTDETTKEHTMYIGNISQMIHPEIEDSNQSGENHNECIEDTAAKLASPNKLTNETTNEHITYITKTSQLPYTETDDNNQSAENHYDCMGDSAAELMKPNDEDSQLIATHVKTLLQLSNSQSCNNHNNYESVNNKDECINDSDVIFVNPNESSDENPKVPYIGKMSQISHSEIDDSNQSAKNHYEHIGDTVAESIKPNKLIDENSKQIDNDTETSLQLTQSHSCNNQKLCEFEKNENESMGHTVSKSVSPTELTDEMPKEHITCIGKTSQLPYTETDYNNKSIENHYECIGDTVNELMKPNASIDVNSILSATGIEASSQLSHIGRQDNSDHPESQHAFMEHINERPSSCLFCAQKFSQKSHLVSHMRIHIASKLNSQDICAKKINLVHHKNIDTDKEPYNCHFCFRKFSQKSHLVHHIKIHKRPMEQQFCSENNQNECLENICNELKSLNLSTNKNLTENTTHLNNLSQLPQSHSYQRQDNTVRNEHVCIGTATELVSHDISTDRNSKLHTTHIEKLSHLEQQDNMDNSLSQHECTEVIDNELTSSNQNLDCDEMICTEEKPCRANCKKLSGTSNNTRPPIHFLNIPLAQNQQRQDNNIVIFPKKRKKSVIRTLMEIVMNDV